MPYTSISSGSGVYSRIILGVEPSLPSQQSIAQAAIRLIARHGRLYAISEAPVSPHPGLTGNIRPGETPLTWLKGWSKCNLFVGDAITAAGFVMPTNRMPDGSLHYAVAESLPFRRDCFKRLANLAEVQPGDIMVIDYAGRGQSGGHTEVIIGCGGDLSFTVAGAHSDGAYLKVFRLDGSRCYDARLEGWSNGRETLYFLRPVKVGGSPSKAQTLS